MLDEIKKDYSIEVMRIIATSLIVLHHFQQVIGCVDNSIFYGGVFPFYTCVELFFIISGWLSYKYINKTDDISILNFFKIKAIRLLPMMIIGVISYDTCCLIYNKLGGWQWPFGTTLQIWNSFITMLGMNAGSVFEKTSINPSTWYVGVLMVCYAVFYIATKLAKKLRINPYYLYITIILLGFGIHTFNISLPFMTFDSARGYISFFWGIILRALCEKRERRKKYIVINLSITLITLYFILFHGNLIDYRYEIYYIMTFFFYTNLVLFFQNLGIKYCKKIRLIDLVGNSSYCVYIMHFPMLLFVYVLNEAGVLIFEYRSVTFMFLFLTIMWLIGIFIHYFIERKIHNWLINRIERK